MSFTMINFIKLHPIKGWLKRISLAMASLCDEKEKDKGCFASLKTIARIAHCSISTVKKYRAILVREGFWFRQEKYHKNGRQRTTTYTFNFIKHYEETFRPYYDDENPCPLPNEERYELPMMEDIVDNLVENFMETQAELDNKCSSAAPSKENNLSSLISLPITSNKTSNFVDNSKMDPEKRRKAIEEMREKINKTQATSKHEENHAREQKMYYNDSSVSKRCHYAKRNAWTSQSSSYAARETQTEPIAEILRRFTFGTPTRDDLITDVKTVTNGYDPKTSLMKKSKPNWII